jgi:uncharacterized protein
VNLRLALVTVLIGIATCPGCGTSPAARFYSLTSRNLDTVSQTGAAFRIAVGGVAVPEIVDRPQIVLRQGANQVTIAEFARWAEPLKYQVPRAIAENLTVLLNGAQVFVYPKSADVEADCQVLLDLQRFDSTLGDAVTVEVLWTVRLAEGGKIRNGRSVVRESISAEGYDALVAAHARALATVSRDIAKAIESLRAPG